ncbi:MAG: hypothetical protein AB1705_14595 [Verrucomicrobiota bacterium]
MWTTITKLLVGAGISKAFLDALVDNLEDLNARVSVTHVIPNGSFEQDTDGDGQAPDGWTKTVQTGGAAAIDSTDSRHGKYSWKATTSGTGGAELKTTDFIPIGSLRTLQLSWDMKSSVADIQNIVRVYWFKADQTAYSTPSTELYNNSTSNPTSWTAFTRECAVPHADVKYCKIELVGGNSADPTAGSCWFDNVRFTDYVLSVHVRKEEASGTAAQSGINTAWTTVLLNTEVNDVGAIASLASDQITLPPGRYEYTFHVPLKNDGTARVVKSRLYNATDTAVIHMGPNHDMAGNASGMISHSSYFELTAGKAIAVQVVSNAVGNLSIGAPASIASTNEIYSEILIRKVG